MNNITDTLIIGAGAMGVPPAAGLLTLAGVRVRFLADTARCERYRREGIFLNGIKVGAEFVTPGELTEVPELVIIATKGFSLRSAIALLKGKTASGTVILPLLNGISAAGELRQAFPECRVLHGLYLGHASVREGNRISWSGCGKIFFGDPTGDKAAVGAVSRLFSRAGIDHVIPDDILAAVWKKFILNVGINQTQALFRADYGMIQRSPELLDYCRDLMREAAGVAVAAGVQIDADTAIGEAMKVVCEMPPEVKTSMLQDVLAGRETEVDLFAGELCRVAARLGLDVPLNRRILSQLSRVADGGVEYQK